MSDLLVQDELELRVVGTLLLSDRQLGETLSLLTPADFTLTGARLLYQAMGKLFLAGKPTDQLSVLLEAGVRVYEFTPGFMHSKLVVSDDRCASVGSCNLDYRSFYLQFENGVWLWDDPAVEAVRDDFLATLDRCREILPRDMEKMPLGQRFMNVFYRLFAPTF